MVISTAIHLHDYYFLVPPAPPLLFVTPCLSPLWLHPGTVSTQAFFIFLLLG